MTSRDYESEWPNNSVHFDGSDGEAAPVAIATGHKLSLLWLYSILNMLFRDVHELNTASAINEIQSGFLNGVPVTEELLIAGAMIVQLPMLALLLSCLLRSWRARLVNLVVAPVAVFGTLAARPSDTDDYLFSAIQIVIFAVIFVTAWRWKAQTPNNSPDPVSK